ncbi:MAG: DUF3006 family protein [Candidatus Bathyarchaeia archaeon]|nr:DUF3006 family protein [Candidatus Bathyarchaeota archaeon]
MEEKVKATVDRIEEGLAVVYSDVDERVYYVPVEGTPGLREGVKVTLTLIDGAVSGVEVMEGETIAAKERLARLMQKLLKRFKEQEKPEDQEEEDGTAD